MNFFKSLTSRFPRRHHSEPVVAQPTPPSPPPAPEVKVVVVDAIKNDRFDRLLDSLVCGFQTAIAEMGKFSKTAAETQKTLQMSVEGNLSGFELQMNAITDTQERHAKLIDEHTGRIDRWGKKCKEYSASLLKQIDRNDKLMARLAELEAKNTELEKKITELASHLVNDPSPLEVPPQADITAVAEKLRKDAEPVALAVPQANAEEKRRDLSLVDGQEVGPSIVSDYRSPRKFNSFRDRETASAPVRFASFNPVTADFKFLKTYEEARNAVAAEMKGKRKNYLMITRFEYLIGLADRYLDHSVRNANRSNGQVAESIKRVLKKAIMERANGLVLGRCVTNPIHVIEKFNELGFFPNGTEMKD